VDSDDTTGPGSADAPDQAEPDQAARDHVAQRQAETRRWLGRLILVALGLWFIVSGLGETWPAAGLVARGLLVAAVLLGVVLFGLGLRHLVRRGRG
jgi:hypothetical protein